jgi:hypothetical protein
MRTSALIVVAAVAALTLTGGTAAAKGSENLQPLPRCDRSLGTVKLMDRDLSDSSGLLTSVASPSQTVRALVVESGCFTVTGEQSERERALAAAGVASRTSLRQKPDFILTVGPAPDGKSIEDRVADFQKQAYRQAIPILGFRRYKSDKTVRLELVSIRNPSQDLTVDGHVTAKSLKFGISAGNATSAETAAYRSAFIELIERLNIAQPESLALR